MPDKNYALRDFEDFTLHESIKSQAEKVSQEIDFSQVEEIGPERLATAISHLVDSDGVLDNMDLDLMEENFTKMLEEANEVKTTYDLDIVLETMKIVAGNKKLVYTLSRLLSKQSGREINDAHMSATLEKISDFLMSSKPQVKKVLEKTLEWISNSLELRLQIPQKSAIMGETLAILLIFCISFFPASNKIKGISGALTLILSGIAMLGSVDKLPSCINSVFGQLEGALSPHLEGKKISDKTIQDEVSKLGWSLR